MEGASPGNIACSNEVVNVLRDNSLAVLLLNAFTRHEGGPYLRATLQPAMLPVITDPAGYEIDPRRMPPHEGASAIKMRTVAVTPCMPLTTTIVNMAGVPPLPDIQQNRVKLVTAVVRVIARLQQQEAAMPASLRRLCVQIRAECLVRMERDRMKHDEYDALPKGLSVG